jgi:hypothetical protein
MNKSLKNIGISIFLTLSFSACSNSYNYTGNTHQYMKYQDIQITNKIVKDNELETVTFNEIIQVNGIVNIDYKRENSPVYGKNNGKYISGIDEYSVCPIDYYLSKKDNQYVLEIKKSDVVELGRKKFVQVLSTCIQENLDVKENTEFNNEVTASNTFNKLNEII